MRHVSTRSIVIGAMRLPCGTEPLENPRAPVRQGVRTMAWCHSERTFSLADRTTLWEPLACVLEPSWVGRWHGVHGLL